MRIYLLWLVLLITPTIIAQKKEEKPSAQLGLIIGNVLEAKTGKPLAFASVQLQLLSDTSKRLSDIADKNGAFEFSKLALGYYCLLVNMVGFAETRIDSINLRPERYDFNLGDVKLNDAASALNEVIVYAEKPLIENKDDKIIYNVGESALSGGATTAELLKNMPLINNDPTGKILLKGKEPKILIDDKPTELNAQQLQDLLESLPGSSIEKIEIMINPPPQYATETGGVINIVTKKGKIGWVGRTTVSGGTRGEGNIALNASYRTQSFSLNITAGVGGSMLTGNSYSMRENIYKDSINYFNTTGAFENRNLRPNLRVQSDFELNRRNQLNITYQGNLNYYDNASNSTFSNINKDKQMYRYSIRTNKSDGEAYGQNALVSYTHRAKNPAEFIRIILNVNFNKNNNDRGFFQKFLRPDMSPTGIDSTQSQFFDNYNRSVSGRIDYNKPLKKKGSNFSTGVTYNRSYFHNTLNTNFLRKSDSLFISNDLLSNDFEFRQDIFTARAGFGLQLNKGWRLNMGVQAEHTAMSFTFFKGNSTNVNNGYWNLLPNFSLRKEFNKTLSTSIVYRATIRRPGIGELNPNVDYSDPYNLRFGNPYLRPTLSDNFDWTISWIKGKYYINTSVGYNKLRDVFNSIRNLAGGGKTELSWLNIADRKEYEVSIWGGYTISRQWRMNTSMGYTMNRYSAAEKTLYKYRNGNSFYNSFHYTFTPSNVLTFEGSVRFNNFANPQGKSRSNVNMNFGVQHRFFDRRLVVNFNAINPFTAQRYTTYTYGANFNLESFNSSNTRNFRLSVSYQLNRVVQKSKLSEKDKKTALQKAKKG
ncbi:MAG: outer membrane beta-barrel protein [Bacteroidota bacterium]